MENNLSFLDIINKQYPSVITKIIDLWDTPIYVVGGWVRDYLMKKHSPDLDLVVEGDALLLGKKIKKRYPLWRLYFFKRYHTIKIVSVFGEIDISSARKEVYPDIAQRPIVELSDIYNDMKRRDFTINAIAINLDTNVIYDPFDGGKDIKQGIIRILHKKSFIDDPTRIIRLARYAVRLNFQIESDTMKCLEEALSMNVFDFLSRERLSKEILTIFKKEKEPYKVIAYMNKLGVISSILHIDTTGIKVPSSLSPVEVFFPFLMELPSDKIDFGLRSLFVSADKYIKDDLKNAGFGF